MKFFMFNTKENLKKYEGVPHIIIDSLNTDTYIGDITFYTGKFETGWNECFCFEDCDFETDLDLIENEFVCQNIDKQIAKEIAETVKKNINEILNQGN